MKRDNELIKKILINVENGDGNADISGYDERNILEHKAYLIEEKYISGIVHPNTEGKQAIVDMVIIFKLFEKGHDFIMNEGDKINKKIEITNNIVNNRDNHGIISIGNENMISTEFNQKFSQLIEAIRVSNIENKNQIIEDLNTHKEDKVVLQEYLGKLLTRSAEVVTLAPIINTLLGLIQSLI